MTDRSIPRPVASAPSRAESLAAAALCAAASLIAILWSWRHGAMLNYGDAVAHLHIARRVFDSHIPRFSELGSVWLPLPHVLFIPFVQVYSWWANGFAAVIPSSLAYLAACAGLYRLARRWLSPPAAAVALAFFAANPNLLYLQTTAMTEPLFVCEMIWIAVWIVEWRAGLDETNADSTTNSGPLKLSLLAVALIAAVFTRYDGWIMAFLVWTSVGILLARRGRLKSPIFRLASAFVVAAPLSWFLYNNAAFGDWLYFVRGPYSAAAIEARTAVPGFPPHPGWHNLWVSFLFFVKAAEMDAVAAAAHGRWGNLALGLAFFGSAWAWFNARRSALGWALLLLWLPVPFYTYSVAYGSVPIFLPAWWPFTWYNLRYGMELLPALALGLGFAGQFILTIVDELEPRTARSFWSKTAIVGMFGLLALNAAHILHERPLVYVEGTKNIEAHRPYEQQIPPVLRALLAERPGGIVLMVTSMDPQIIALTGIPLRQTINESDLWIWDSALTAPAAHASVVLAFDGDPVDAAVHLRPAGLTLVRRFQAPGQPAVTIYIADPRLSSAFNNPNAPVIASLKAPQ